MYRSLKFMWEKKKTTNHQELRIVILQKHFLDGVPLKGYVAS